MRTTEEWYEIIVDYAGCYNLSHLKALDIVFQGSTEDEFTDEQFDELEQMFISE